MIRVLFSWCLYFNLTVNVRKCFRVRRLRCWGDGKRCDRNAQPKPENSFAVPSREVPLKAMALTPNICNRLLLQASPDQVQKDAVASHDYRKSYLQKAHWCW
jgi:hypothetical protein